MTLTFQKQIENRPTYFSEKIINGLLKSPNVNSIIKEQVEKYYKNKNGSFHTEKIKIHTIRQDKNNCWYIGQKIHFKEWEEKPYRSKTNQFAPILKVTNIETIQIKWNKKTKQVFVYINNQLISDEEIIELSKNDGFDNVIDFLEYFSEDFRGKIIHWTNFKYKK